MSVNYSVEVPGIGYYINGTLLANSRVNLPLSYSVLVSSYNDQNNGIYLCTSSDKVIVIGQSADGRFSRRRRRTARNLDTFVISEIKDLFISDYKYFAVSANSSSRNSSVLIVGTRNDTLLKLMVTQPVTTRVGNANVTTLIPGKMYSFVIYRLQTVYLSSSYDLTRTRIVTNKPVSVFSGHGCAAVPMDAYPCSYMVEQMPPTALWGSIYYVIPFVNHHIGYALKILAANECVVNIHCINSTNFSTLRIAENVSETFLCNETCTVWSVSKILVVQFPLGGYQYNGGPMMSLVPPSIHYHNKIFFSPFLEVDSDYIYYRMYDQEWIHYINVIVPAEYYQPDMIYLVNNGINKSMDTQEWMPIKFDNITKAYGTIISNISSVGMSEIIHTDKAALMSVIIYGFTEYGGYGTTANIFTSEIGIVF